MTLSQNYNALADIWRWGAREYLERAHKADTSIADNQCRVKWNDLAISASRRAARYARMAHIAGATDSTGGVS